MTGLSHHSWRGYYRIHYFWSLEMLRRRWKKTSCLLSEGKKGEDEFATITLSLPPHLPSFHNSTMTTITPLSPPSATTTAHTHLLVERQMPPPPQQRPSQYYQ